MFLGSHILWSAKAPLQWNIRGARPGQPTVEVHQRRIAQINQLQLFSS